MGDYFEWVLQVAVLALVTGLAFAGIFISYRRARRIEDTPTSNIKTAAQGYVELTGKARKIDGESVYAPISGKECLWYRYVVEERKGVLPPARFEWRIVKRGVSKELFKLVDDTGECVVVPKGADVSGVAKTRWHGDTPDDSASALIPGMFRYTEELIHAEMPLYVIGHFATVTGVAGLPVVREPLQKLLDGWRADRGDLILTTDESQTGLEKRHFHLIGAAEDSTYPLMFSTSSERHTARHYRKQSVIAILLFFVFGSMLVWHFQSGL